MWSIAGPAVPRVHRLVAGQVLTAPATARSALDMIEPPRRNLMWVLFAEPSTRDLIVDWDIHARQALAEFLRPTPKPRLR